jgi:hypothetical protein
VPLRCAVPSLGCTGVAVVRSHDRRVRRDAYATLTER